jgi:thiol-disulfide isomerase/thioredoxin
VAASADASAAPAARAPSAAVTPAPSAALEEASAEWIEVSGAGLVERVKSSGYRAVIVNAWASWCGPCRREMPMLLGLQANLAPRGIGVFLVSVDEPSSRPAALAFLQEHGAPLPSYVAERPLGPFKAALNPEWPGMLPASFLFDASWKLRYYWAGEAFEHELLQVADEFLAGTLVDGAARFGLIPGKVEGR